MMITSRTADRPSPDPDPAHVPGPDRPQGNPAPAVVDRADGVPVVWWVDLGPRVVGMSRLCGAWVLDRHDVPTTLHALTTTRTVLATAAGRALLDEHRITVERVLDPAGTLAAVAAGRDELQDAYERAVLTRANGRALIAPTWPTLPAPLDVETALAPSGDPRAARALGIARWLAGLCTAWDGVEAQRLARSYLTALAGPTARTLPLVLRAGR